MTATDGPRKRRAARRGRSLAPCAATGTLLILSLVSAFAQDAASQSATSPVVGEAALPRDLSPWGMFMSADVVVKAVIIGLVVASVVTWTIWLVKTIEIAAAKRRTRAALRTLAAAR